MAEYTRGQDRSGNEDSGHNIKVYQSPRISPVQGFEGMNYEQVRAPYQSDINRGRRFEADKETRKSGRQRGEI
jgi:hypothetical protein